MQRTLSLTLVVMSIMMTIASSFQPELLYYAAHSMTLYFGLSLDRVLPEILMYQFLHGGFLHVLMNAFFLLYFGVMLEKHIGIREYFAFFIANTVAVYVAILMFSRGPVIGISGFCMAVLAYTALELRSKGSPEANWAIAMLVINILIGFTGSISLVGHAAGAIFGLAWWQMKKNAQKLQKL